MKYLRDESYINSFGKRLKSLREKKEFSQEKLALVSGIAQSQIARTELGLVNTSISHLNCYAKALEIMPKELLDF